MKKFFSVLVFFAWILPAGMVTAQEAFWVQVEANATLREAEASARRYSERIEAVNGFRIGASGWYATAIGPFTEAAATARLLELRAGGAIPADAYVSDSRPYSQQFWPVGADALAEAPAGLPDAPATPPAPRPEQAQTTQAETAAAAEPEPAAAPEPTPAPAVEPEPAVVAEPEPAPQPEPIREETRQEALQSEYQLTSDEKKALQVALQWQGYYKSLIDGDFGPGTRASMSAWQTDNGYEATGILTTRQRAEVLGAFQAVFDSMGLAPVTDQRAGISIDIPTAMVSFDRYEAPFAHYTGDQGVQVVLISQVGDKATLYGLYDILQSLEVVPPEGERRRRDADFTIEGANDRLISYTQATLVDGAIKGFMLIWPQDPMAMNAETGAMERTVDRRRALVLDAMRQSFASTGATALPDNAGLDQATQSIDLVSGLEIRRAEKARSGFFVSNRGAVLTTTEAVAGCERITLNESYDATVVATDEGLGIALLQPVQALAPIAVAELLTYDPRLKSELAVAGYSYGGRLSSPTLTFGVLADVRGLSGEDNVARLTMMAQDGDTGGPVLDQGGAVIGMLLAPFSGTRQLPAEVALSAKSTALAAFLASNGITAPTTEVQGVMTPYDLQALAANMTVLVSCWK
jgi:S1-C subfamily serine protease/peptidoglycan hydrolase-like protein with peptidoglycan-binding domain